MMHYHRLRSRRRAAQRGFSILEVLIALLVLMFGVLGMIGMQTMAINNTEIGRYTSRAAIEAASIGAAMKADASYWNAPPGTVTVQAGTGQWGQVTVTGGPALSSAWCNSVTAPPVCSGSGCQQAVANNNCNSQQTAYYDLAVWGADIATALPSGTLTIACATSSGSLCASPALYLVTISWVEKNIALHNAIGIETGLLATGTSQTHTDQTMVSVL